MGKRLFVTCDGELGNGPLEARREDEVFVLLNCSVPVVLRRVGPRQREVVGECYLNSYMNGEITAPLERGDVTSMKLQLV